MQLKFELDKTNKKDSEITVFVILLLHCYRPDSFNLNYL